MPLTFDDNSAIDKFNRCKTGCSVMMPLGDYTNDTLIFELTTVESIMHRGKKTQMVSG